MKGFRTTEEDIKIKENVIELKKQFEVEFNRYYCTKRYTEAFNLCVQNLSDTENKDFVKSKSKLAIEKLTNRIVLSDTSRINQDWVTDTLVNLGKKNMKIQDCSISVGISKISIENNEKINIVGRTNVWVVILVVYSCLFWIFIGVGAVLTGYEAGYWDAFGNIILISLNSLISIILPVVLITRRKRELIQTIAVAIVEEYYNS